MEKQFNCPLCDSILSESKYYEVIRVEDEKKKFEANLKKQLDEAKKNKEKLLKEKKDIQQKLIQEKVILKKKFEAQFKKQKENIVKIAKEEANKLVKKDIEKINKEKLKLQRENKKELIKTKKEALEQGKEHEKKRTYRLTKMMEGKVKALEESRKTIEELKEQLKKGTTPQLEGLNLEGELVKELKSKFPQDRIEHKGHGGDILHYIISDSKEIGLIVYECKKTQKFQKNYIRQIKNDVAKRNATYGVLVTAASERNKSGFWVDNDILIVHPYGTIYIAEVLRKGIINLYSLQLDKKELSECAKKLLDYIKSDKFKNCVQDNIYRTKELHELLRKEMTAHKSHWEKRIKHYSKISENSKSVEKDSSAILINEKEGLGEIEEEAEFEIIPLVKKKKRKKSKGFDY